MPDMGGPAVSFVIPTFNGRELLAAHLPAVLRAAGDAEVVVVDDGSQDGTSAWLPSAFPEVRCLALQANRGFGESCNLGVANTRGHVILLLNNDVEPETGCISTLLGHFQRPDVFAVGAHLTDVHSGQTEFYLPQVWRGLFRISRPEKLPAGPTPALYACAGAAAYRREMWDALGGFDPLYRPFYWEDVDLCYRAWKRGWVTLFEPGARAQHWTNSTIGRVAPRRDVLEVASRNSLIFFWKNITDRGLMAQHLLHLPRHLLWAWRSGDEHCLLPGIRGALRLLPQVLPARRAEASTVHYADRTVLARLAAVNVTPDATLPSTHASLRRHSPMK